MPRFVLKIEWKGPHTRVRSYHFRCTTYVLQSTSPTYWANAPPESTPTCVRTRPPTSTRWNTAGISTDSSCRCKAAVTSGSTQRLHGEHHALRKQMAETLFGSTSQAFTSLLQARVQSRQTTIKSSALSDDACRSDNAQFISRRYKAWSNNIRYIFAVFLV